MFTFIACRSSRSIPSFSNFLYCNFSYCHRLFSINFFQMFSIYSNTASASACNAKRSKILKTLQNQASPNYFCTPLQQLPQGHTSANFKELPPFLNTFVYLMEILTHLFHCFLAQHGYNQARCIIFYCFLKRLFPCQLSVHFFSKGQNIFVKTLPSCLHPLSKKRRPLSMLPKPLKLPQSLKPPKKK